MYAVASIVESASTVVAINVAKMTTTQLRGKSTRRGHAAVLEGVRPGLASAHHLNLLQLASKHLGIDGGQVAHSALADVRGGPCTLCRLLANRRNDFSQRRLPRTFDHHRESPVGHIHAPELAQKRLRLAALARRHDDDLLRRVVEEIES